MKESAGRIDTAWIDRRTQIDKETEGKACAKYVAGGLPMSDFIKCVEDIAVELRPAGIVAPPSLSMAK